MQRFCKLAVLCSWPWSKVKTATEHAQYPKLLCVNMLGSYYAFCKNLEKSSTHCGEVMSRPFLISKSGNVGG